jgi:FkbM family methyltransferase
VFYDVGANVGFVSALAARCAGPGGRVVAFEPLPANMRWLRHNLGLNRFSNAEAHDVALGDRDGVAEFIVAEESGLGKLSGYEKSHEAIAGRIEVRVRRLDDYRGAAGLPAPSVIKVDVEGAEAEVLRGASATIAACRPVLMVELHDTNAAVAEVLGSLSYLGRALGPVPGILEAGPAAIVLAAHGDDAAGLARIAAICGASRAIR